MSIVSEGGAVWASTQNGGFVKRLGEARGAVTDEMKTGGSPAALASSKHRLFIALSEGRVLAVDLAKRKVVGRYPVGNLPDGLAVGDDALWVSYDADLPPYDINKLTRIPLSTPLSPQAALPVVGQGSATPFKASYDYVATHWHCSGARSVDSNTGMKDSETCVLRGDTSHLVAGSFKGDPSGAVPWSTRIEGWDSDFDDAVATSWTIRAVQNGDGTWTLHVVAHY